MLKTKESGLPAFEDRRTALQKDLMELFRHSAVVLSNDGSAARMGDPRAVERALKRVIEFAQGSAAYQNAETAVQLRMIAQMGADIEYLFGAPNANAFCLRFGRFNWR